MLSYLRDVDSKNVRSTPSTAGGFGCSCTGANMPEIGGICQWYGPCERQRITCIVDGRTAKGIGGGSLYFVANGLGDTVPSEGWCTSGEIITLWRSMVTGCLQGKSIGQMCAQRGWPAETGTVLSSETED